MTKKEILKRLIKPKRLINLIKFKHLNIYILMPVFNYFLE